MDVQFNYSTTKTQFIFRFIPFCPSQNIDVAYASDVLVVHENDKWKLFMPCEVGAYE